MLNADSTSNIADCETEIVSVECDIINDGIGKKKWKAFWSGFTEGLSGVKEPVGQEAAQANYMKGFFQTQLSNGNDCMDLFFNLNTLILDENNSIVNESRLLPILYNDQNAVNIAIQLLGDDATNSSPPGEVGDGWRKFGKILGSAIRVLGPALIALLAG
jgi:hypothetical protein